MVDLFELIEEGVEFVESANTLVPVDKVANAAYLLIPRTVGIGKSCEWWDDMQIGLKIWQAFKDHFSKTYRRKHFRKKATAVAHGYGAAANNT